MLTKPISLTLSGVAMIVGLLTTVSVPAYASAAEQQTPQTESADGQNMMAMRKNMMAMHQKMMADTDAADARLQVLVEQMTAATGDAKIDAIGAVLTELVVQHRAAQQRMGQMMMPGMMQMMSMMEGMGANMQKMMGGRGGTAPPEQ